VPSSKPRPDGRLVEARLVRLAPDIVEAALVGRTDQALILEQVDRPLPPSWAEQRPHVFSAFTP
jgi:hypothetical protein